MSLQGKTILITRATSQAEDFARKVVSSGGIPVSFPTIEIMDPDSREGCDRAITGLYMYDGLIFTGANAVRYFFRRKSALMPIKCIAQVVSEIKTPGVPILVFFRDCTHSLSKIAPTGCQVVGLDWAMDIAEGTAMVVLAYLRNFPFF